MRVVLFTKTFAGNDVGDIVETALDLGLGGLDLAVREGHAVNPGNVRRALPEAVEACRSQGMEIALVTAETSLTDPKDGAARTLWRACGESGIPNIKVGYWRWEADRDYWPGVDAIRRDLEGFEALGREFGVRALVHTHSGHNFGSTGHGLMSLIGGFDPEHVGGYIDPAHLALGGEPLEMALQMVGGHLQMVAAKNARRLPSRDGETTVWKTDWCMLAEGFVDWREAIAALRARGYEGAVSLHGEYSGLEEGEQVLRRLGVDARYLRGIVGGR